MQINARRLRRSPRTTAPVCCGIESVEPRLMFHTSAPVIPIASSSSVSVRTATRPKPCQRMRMLRSWSSSIAHGSVDAAPCTGCPTDAAPDVIDLTQSFNTTTNPTRVAFGFDVGRVIVELFDTTTPKTVANFLTQGCLG